MVVEKQVISVVSPVYGCEGSIRDLYLRISKTLESARISFEIIFVVDGSPDHSWKVVEELAVVDERVKGILLSRNFGQHNAISAGLEHVTGDWVVVMDCDLQDQPEEIMKLYNKALEGYDIVLGKRQERKDNLIKRLLSKSFYKILSYLTRTIQDPSIGNFGIYRKPVIEAVCRLGDYQRFFPTMVRWVGFSTTTLQIKHARRTIGKTTYSFRKTLNLALDVMIAFSDRPLKLIVKLGFGITLLSFLFLVIIFVRYVTGEIMVLGYTSIIISIWFLSGIIILILGIIGLYLAKTYEKTKDRPQYIIKQKINMNP
jgi:dolichol-phosphate mannosyltransferase